MLLYIMFYDKVFYCDMFLCLYDCFFYFVDICYAASAYTIVHRNIVEHL